MGDANKANTVTPPPAQSARRVSPVRRFCDDARASETMVDIRCPHCGKLYCKVAGSDVQIGAVCRECGKDFFAFKEERHLLVHAALKLEPSGS